MKLRVEPKRMTVRPAPPTHGIPTLKYARQQEDCWCWAACVEMILRHYCLFEADGQCKIAEKGLKIKHPNGQFTCCPHTGITGRCDGDGGCDQALGNLQITRLWSDQNGGYGIPVETTSLRGPQDGWLVYHLREMLDRGHPVELGYSGSTTGHVVILFGWDVDAASGEIKFFVHDPAACESATVRAGGLLDNGGALDAYWVILKTEAERRCGDGNQ